MSSSDEFLRHASELNKILLNRDDSEILKRADELLLFLNRLRDFLQYNPHPGIPFSSVSDIVHGLESHPEVTLRNKDVRERLLNLFVKLIGY